MNSSKQAEAADNTEEIPLTLDWLVHGKQRKTRTSTCVACREEFRHGSRWAGEGCCPKCVAHSMDKENAKGFAKARSLGLFNFRVARRYGSPSIYGYWACKVCNYQNCARLADMQTMTSWKAACPTCVRALRYADLAQSRYFNLLKRVRFLAKTLELDVLKTKNGKGIPGPKNFFAHISCQVCGEHRTRSLLHLEQGLGCSCTMPSSSGEAAVALYLKQHGIQFIREFNLSRLGLQANFRFDFFLSKHAIAIEYDGRQHFEPVDFFGGAEGLATTQANDRKKNELAAQAGVTVLRVPYHCENIHAFLGKYLQALL